jgi:hypothetical protein
MPRTSKFWSRRRLRLGLVTVLAFLFFQGRVEPRSEFVTRTADESSSDSADHQYLKSLNWVSSRVAYVADDGQSVVLASQNSMGFSLRSPRRVSLQLWDTPTGLDVSPRHWREEPMSGLLVGTIYHDPRLPDTLAYPSGEQLLRDPDHWQALHERFRARAGHPDAIPETVRFGRDGQYVAYGARQPSHGDFGTGRVVIENARTGQRVALLPGHANSTDIAPGGRTAITWTRTRFFDDEEDALLWDLETGANVGRLDGPVTHPDRQTFTADGRFIFWYASGLLWWRDTTTGRLVGKDNQVDDWASMSGGRTLLTRDGPSGGVNYVTFRAWDVATGTKTEVWDLDYCPKGAAGSLSELIAAANGPFAALTYRPDSDAAAGGTRIEKWIAEKMPQPSITTKARILVVNTERRKLVARLPGESAVFSHNGRWLATLDAAGVLRVYELPLQKPWARIFGYTVLTALAFWLVGFVRRFLRSRRESGESSSPAG